MELFSLILNFVLSSGILGLLLFYSSKRRKAAAEAFSAENDAKGQEFSIQKINIEFLSSQLQEAWAEVEKMQQIINGKRDNILSLMSQTKQLEIELLEHKTARKRSEIYRCYRTECVDRDVQSSMLSDALPLNRNGGSGGFEMMN